MFLHRVKGSEVVRPDHHGGGPQGVAGPSEMVPLDAVEFSNVVSNGVIDTVQVGEAAGVKPPTYEETRGKC